MGVPPAMQCRVLVRMYRLQYRRL